MKIIDLIINPDKFFQNVGVRPYNRYVPLIAILLNTFASALSLLTLKGNCQPTTTIIVVIISIMVLLLLILLDTMIIDVLLYVTKLKDISFKKIFEIIAYGYIITAFSDIIIDMLNYINGGSPMPQWLNYLIYIIFTIWACLIWAKGIQYTYSLKFNKSLILAIVVGIINLVLYTIR
ncbi:YIP1 family protein [Methanothermococcus okinawensis]|uniref:Yip1 domain-containing protein n=1 Tax=Methanothermococcus okinawensis (strain DSM 14208 / JCM 11175 / IH1) TaxID=647113 RepID=F8AM23_METOI|nr:YIP1 family protein [Methanothermococcus okinawensis]AEH06704.1 hypothetical protein Metok_0727 [Methanothermococcus okinawensis IH1]